MQHVVRRLALAVLTMLACADDGDAQSSGGSSGSSGTAGGSTTPPATTSTTADTSGEQDGTGAGDTSTSATSDDTGLADSSTGEGPGLPPVLCGTPPPEGAELPPPLPTYSGGVCPPVVPGLNVIASLGDARQFHVIVPDDLQPDERLPVVFLWHWLGGSANAFIEIADLQNAANQLRFAAAVPVEKGDLLFRWPFSAIDSDARMQEEFAFFDDMLACIADSYPIDNQCVSSAGVSAGGLFTAQLGWGRSEYLSSIMVLSGGVGGLTKPWNGATHIIPAMVLWGGAEDFCIAIDFEATSHALQTALVEDGHPILECVHNCGHSEPPFEPPFPDATPFAGMWRFWLDHPHWLEDGESPWSESVPEGTPEWCAMGVGVAVPRVGECGGASC